MANFQKIAKEFADAFTFGNRASTGERYTFLRDGSPEWMKDAVYSAHGSGQFLPNDWIYLVCRSAAQDMASEESESARDWRDSRSHDWADGEVDTGDASALAWGSDNYGLASQYEYEAEAELGKIGGSAARRLQVAQFFAASAIGNAIAEAIQAQVDAAEAVDA